MILVQTRWHTRMFRKIMKLLERTMAALCLGVGIFLDRHNRQSTSNAEKFKTFRRYFRSFCSHTITKRHAVAMPSSFLGERIYNRFACLTNTYMKDRAVLSTHLCERTAGDSRRCGTHRRLQRQAVRRTIGSKRRTGNNSQGEGDILRDTRTRRKIGAYYWRPATGAVRSRKGIPLTKRYPRPSCGTGTHDKLRCFRAGL